jgi:MFS family permease
VTEIEASWIGSLMPLAALIGGFAGGPLLELLGRKLTILLTAPPFIVAGLMVTYADSVGIIYAGRDRFYKAPVSAEFFWGVSDPLCLSSSSALHFFQLFFLVHHPVNRDARHLFAHARVFGPNFVLNFLDNH